MKYKNILSPSILSADFGNLARDIHTIDEAVQNTFTLMSWTEFLSQAFPSECL